MLNDENSSHLLYFNCALRWFALRMDILMNIVTFIAALLVTLSFPAISASSKGLSLSYIIQVTAGVGLGVREGDCNRKPNSTGSKQLRELRGSHPAGSGGYMGFESGWVMPPALSSSCGDFGHSCCVVRGSFRGLRKEEGERSSFPAH